MKGRRIVIVGFMGSGKTTVARAVARRLACDFVDLDSFITKREGRSPAEIIQEDGEPVFRLVEMNALRNVLEESDARVIALGGGAWIIEANRALVTEHDCLSVWLDAPFALCWKRITSNRNTMRPMARNRESTRKLYVSRRVSYEMSTVRVDVSSENLAEAANKILQMEKSEAP